MTGQQLNNWQDVQAEVLKRIQTRFWKPGDLIPNEAELANEFGCARTTVNRALRSVAESGLLDRRRKAGTRVALNPVRKATLAIPILRREIEAKNQLYSHALLALETKPPPVEIGARMKLDGNQDCLHLTSLHMADGQAYASEDRWINQTIVPGIIEADFATISANEWLVANAPFTHGDIAFSAVRADREISNQFSAPEGSALFSIERTTWNHGNAITFVQMIFHPGYRMHTTI